MRHGREFPNRATLYLFYTSLCTGELNAIRKHKRFLCSPFYGRACRWAMLGELKPKGPKGPFPCSLISTFLGATPESWKGSSKVNSPTRRWFSKVEIATCCDVDVLIRSNTLVWYHSKGTGVRNWIRFFGAYREMVGEREFFIDNPLVRIAS